MTHFDSTIDTIYLDPQYTCESCGGHGYHTRKWCPNIRADLLVLGVAFIILKADAPTSITCPKCGTVSLDPEDTLAVLRGRMHKHSRKKRYLKLCDTCTALREVEHAEEPADWPAPTADD
jgi:hypothetical protein